MKQDNIDKLDKLVNDLFEANKEDTAKLKHKEVTLSWQQEVFLTHFENVERVVRNTVREINERLNSLQAESHNYKLTSQYETIFLESPKIIVTISKVNSKGDAEDKMGEITFSKTQRKELHETDTFLVKIELDSHFNRKTDRVQDSEKEVTVQEAQEKVEDTLVKYVAVKLAPKKRNSHQQ